MKKRSLIFVISVFLLLGGAPAAHASYTLSQIGFSHGGGQSCGVDVNGGAGTAVTGGYWNNGFYNSAGQYDPTAAPAGFYDNPAQYCFYESEKWVNTCKTCGGDTFNNWGWEKYNSTYVSKGGTGNLLPSGDQNPSHHNFLYNDSFYAIAPPAPQTPASPVASLSVSPSSVVAGNSAALTWSCTNSTSASIDQGIGSVDPAGGTISVSPPSTTTYTLTCTGAGGTSSTATPASYSWKFDYCTAGGSWPPLQTAVLGASCTQGSLEHTEYLGTSCYDPNSGQWYTGQYAFEKLKGVQTAPASGGSSGTAASTATATATLTVVAPPAAPTLACPVTATVGQAASFSVSGTDPGGNSLHYGFDWIGAGIVGQWIPASGYVPSGTQETASHVFDTAGAYTVQALSQNQNGDTSGWSSCTLNVVGLSVTPPGTNPTTTPPAPGTPGGNNGGNNGGGNNGGNGGPSPGPSGGPLVVPAPIQVSALLTADHHTIPFGSFATLTWSSSPNVVSCTGSSDTGAPFDTKGKLAGVFKVSPVSKTNYSLACYDSAGDAAYDGQTIDVTPPTLVLNASPTLVRSGSSTTISWSGGAGSCSISGPGLSSTASSGSVSETISAQSTYTFSCVAGPYTPSTSVTVKVAPSFREF